MYISIHIYKWKSIPHADTPDAWPRFQYRNLQFPYAPPAGSPAGWLVGWAAGQAGWVGGWAATACPCLQHIETFNFPMLRRLAGQLDRLAQWAAGLLCSWILGRLQILKILKNLKN